MLLEVRIPADHKSPLRKQGANLARSTLQKAGMTKIRKVSYSDGQKEGVLTNVLTNVLTSF